VAGTALVLETQARLARPNDVGGRARTNCKHNVKESVMANKIAYPDAKTMAEALKGHNLFEVHVTVLCEEKPIQYGYGEHKTFINHEYETVVVTAEVEGRIHEGRFRILILSQFDQHDETKIKERYALARQRENEIRKFFEDHGFTLKSGIVCPDTEKINSHFPFSK